MTRPIVHDFWGSWETWEYPFPLSERDFAEYETQEFSPWFQRLVGSSGTEVLQILRQDLAHLTSPAACRFRDSLLSLHDAKSIVIDHYSGRFSYPRLVLSNRVSERDLLLIEPQAFTVEQHRLLAGFPAEGLGELAVHFRCDVAHPGCFTAADEGLRIEPQLAEKSRLTARKWTRAENKRYGAWLDSIPVYFFGSGDALYLRRDGVIGRWWHEGAWSPNPDWDEGMTLAYESFEEWIQAVNEFAAGTGDHLT